MKIKISFLILLLIIYMPFENMIIKFIPCSDTVFGYIRFAIELFGYLLFMILIVRNAGTGKILNKTLIDIPFLAFLFYGIAIIFIDQAPVVASIVDIRTLLKYSVFYFIIANIDFDYKAVRKMFNIFMAIAFIQSFITAYQHFMGISEFWYPRASALEIGGQTTTFHLLMEGNTGGREQGAGIGTFGDTVPLGNFMVMAICLVTPMLLGYIRYSAYRTLFNLFTFVMILLALFFTYSRGSLLVGLLAIPLVFIISRKVHKLYPVLLIFSFFVVGYVAYLAVAPKTQQAYYNPKFTYTDPVSNFTELFSSSYEQNTLENSRGYVVTQLLPKYLATIPLTGYGPCAENSLTIMANNVLGENNFVNDNIMIIADVWWVSLLASYGLIGAALFFSILGFLFYGAFIVFKRTEHPEFKIMGLALMVIILVSIPYTAIIRTFLFRPFAFYFWVFSGIVASEYRRIIAKQNAEKQEELIALRLQKLEEVSEVHKALGN